jgi:hypothetical protein
MAIRSDILREGYRSSLPTYEEQEEDLYIGLCGNLHTKGVYQTMSKSQGGQKNANQKV